MQISDFYITESTEATEDCQKILTHWLQLNISYIGGHQGVPVFENTGYEFGQ